MKKAWLIFPISILIVFFDQITKVFVERNIKSIEIISNFLSFTFVKNSGSIFGLFQDQNVLLVWFSVIVIGLILFYYDKIPEKTSVQLYVSLVLGGAVGNLIDRYRLGYVIDFIDFNLWPTVFNIADLSLTIGIIGLIIYTYKNEK